jgi:hypothetical protein
MPLRRREFLNLVAGGVATGVLLSTPMSQAAPGPKIKALAFDAFPIFDLCSAEIPSSWLWTSSLPAAIISRDDRPYLRKVL